jgi:hypothetical protein
VELKATDDSIASNEQEQAPPSGTVSPDDPAVKKAIEILQGASAAQKAA